MNNRYKVRTGFTLLFFCLLYAVILFNLYLIQIKQRDFFIQLGKQQYNVTVTTVPPRAPIFDRSGKQLLAVSKDSIAAFTLPKKIEKREKLESFLQKHFPIAHERLAHNDSHFMYIERRLSDEKVRLIQEADLADIYILREPSRFYPSTPTAAIIGITDIDNKGLFGIELQYNDQLIGKPTTYTLEKDARSGFYYFKKEVKVEGQQGIPLTLTIDSNLQFLAQEELAETLQEFQAKEGAILIMDPASGEILVMVTLPSFDPNETTVLDLERTKNKVITESYELGSVIKVCSALAALEEGVVTRDEIIDCENVATTHIDGRRVNTVPSTVLGKETFSRVIEKSNNIGIAKVTSRLGPTLYDHYLRMGFAKKTGIEFPGEQEGFVNNPKNWSKQSIFSLAYGYEMRATLLQLAQVFCMIANNGSEIQPTLIFSQEKNKPGKKLYSDQAIQSIKSILERTTMQGTARRARINGYNIMSKTGTANILVDGVYCPTKNMYTCSGIVERDDYKRVVVTFVKESPKKNLYATRVAAPLFQRVAEKMLIHDKII